MRAGVLLLGLLFLPWAAGDSPVVIEDETGETATPRSIVPVIGAQYECRDARMDLARTVVTVEDELVRVRAIMADLSAAVLCDGPLSERATWPRDHEEFGALLHGGEQLPYVSTSHNGGETWAVCGPSFDMITILPTTVQAMPDGWVLTLPTGVASDACSFEFTGALFVRASSTSAAHADWDPIGPGMTVGFGDGFDDVQVR